MTFRVHGLVQNTNDLNEVGWIPLVDQDMARCMDDGVRHPRPPPRMA
jgi:hypothetical protein